MLTPIGKLKGMPEHLSGLRIPPAWTDVMVDPSIGATVLATGFDVAGRKQRLYSPEHHAQAKGNKFERVRALMTEWEDIRSQIEADVNSGSEPALIALLTYEVGIRPGSTTDTRAKVQAYGSTTLQLKHVRPCARGCRLKFVGKKGVRQNILVTNPHLVKVFLARKSATTAYSTNLFQCSDGLLRHYFRTLGTGGYTTKDFRTCRGTTLALSLLGNRKRLPRAKSRRKALVNKALDKVARQLGNTRAVSRSAYVDPVILEKFI